MPTMWPLGNATVQHRWATQRCCARIITMRFTPECGRSGSKMASRGLSRHPAWIPINGLGAIDSGGKLIVTEHVYGKRPGSILVSCTVCIREATDQQRKWEPWQENRSTCHRKLLVPPKATPTLMSRSSPPIMLRNHVRERHRQLHENSRATEQTSSF